MHYVLVKCLDLAVFERSSKLCYITIIVSRHTYVYQLMSVFV